MPYINLNIKTFGIHFFFMGCLLISATASALVCNVTPSPGASLKGTWIDKIRPFDGKSTYKFVVNYVPPKLQKTTTCVTMRKNGGFPSFGIVEWEECTTTEKCVAGYFEGVFTLDNLVAQSSVFNAKLKGVENGTWVSFDHKQTINNSNGSVTTTLNRYWLQPTSDKNKATFVIWKNPGTSSFVETWKDPLIRL